MQPPMSQSFFIGTLAHTPALGQLDILKDHLLIVDPQGYITHLDPLSSPVSQQILSDRDPTKTTLTTVPPNSFLLPTFTDLHLHAPQYLYAGTGLDQPLMQWLERYAFKAEQRIDADNELAKRVYDTLGRRLIEVGTGAALVFGTINTDTNLTLAQTFLNLGLRGYIGKLSMDQNSSPNYIEHPEAALSSASAFIDSIRSLDAGDEGGFPRMVHPVITPRFVPTCSDELLVGLGTLSKEKGVRVMSHMCEARDQVDWVKNTRGGKEDVEIFDQTGLLDKSVQAHCTFLTPENIDTIVRSKTAVAHCPLSNAYFSSKIFPLRECLDRDVPVGLGSDIAGGYQLDLLVQMRQAVVVARLRDSQAKEDALTRSVDEANGDRTTMGVQDLRSTWKETLFLATRGGALALNEDRVGGRFKVGESFDAQLIELLSPTDHRGTGDLDFFDVDPVSGQTALEWDEMIERWWCMGDKRNRKAVWVQGRKLM